MFQRLHSFPRMVALLFLSASLTPQASTLPDLPASTANAETAISPLCAAPTSPAQTREETAWRLFAHAFCPRGRDGQINVTTWTEQTCLKAPATPGCEPGGPARRFLHASHLLVGGAQRVSLSEAPATLGCSPMLTPASFQEGPLQNSPLKPFVPKNLSKNAMFCEEVFVNDAQVSFIKAPPGGRGLNLQSLEGQAKYVAATGRPLQFPTNALEVKLDWLPADAVVDAQQQPAFDCNSRPIKDVYTEVIDGKCYALVGVHISSKLYPNWLWATFEPQNTMTNPNRCNPRLYSDCRDPWGSSPLGSTGAPTRLTPALQELMSGAGLAPAFRNYRLVGVQTEYDQPKGTMQLGNSFVEYNANVNPGQASCITCHAYASFNKSVNPPKENGNFSPFPGSPAIGRPRFPVAVTPEALGSPTAKWELQDFSWLLGFMPQQGNQKKD